MNTVSNPNAHLLNLTFRPTVRLVSVVRRFVSDLYGEVLVDADATDFIAMATHELLENSVKYSTDGSSVLTITVSDDPNGRRVVVETANPSNSLNTARVVGLIEQMSRADPMKEYVALMAETAPRKEGSGLGLARLRAEAGLRMSCRVDGDSLVIVAEMLIPSSAAS